MNSQTQTKTKEKGTVSWILSFAGQKKGYYIGAVLLAIIGAVFQILPFFLIYRIVEELLAGVHSFSAFAPLLLWTAVFWLIRCLCHSLSTSCSHLATFTVLGNIRKQGLEKLAKMPLGAVQARGTGELKNILFERVDSIETSLAHIIPEVSGDVAVVLGTLIYLFALNWKMALVALITFPIGMVCMGLMRIDYDKDYGRAVRATKNLNDTAVEYIGGIEVIKVFGKARSSYEKFVDAAKEGANSYIDWMRKCNLPFTFALNIMPSTLITVLPIGTLMVLHGTLSTLDFIQIVILSMGLITPIISMMTYQDDMAKIGTIMNEVVGIIDADEMERPAENRKKPRDASIALEDVHFGYNDQEVLHGIDLQIPSGSVTALVGPSGGGKSTIAKLIASFWDPNQGSIRIGGVDAKDLSMDEYYRQVAYVAQDNFLFDETIRENIRMGRPGATDEEVEQVARDCGVHDFIRSLENGFDTVVGSGGGHLSGGERQRICIARAMLKDAPIVILDEATAYTDPENEALIQEAVSRLVAGKTLILIAHRLSTITDADQIVVINQGQVENVGTHEELLRKSLLYQNQWRAHISAKDDLDADGEPDDDLADMRKEA